MIEALLRAPRQHEYSGLSYEAASRKAHELIASAFEHEYWRYLPEHLIELRSQMSRWLDVVERRPNVAV